MVYGDNQDINHRALRVTWSIKLLPGTSFSIDVYPLFIDMELVTSSARDSRSAVYFGIVFSCLPTMSRANLMITQRISLLLIIFA